MSSIADQVRNGFIEYIDEVKKNAEGNVKVTLTKFNTRETTVYTAKPIEEIISIDYSPNGMTALYDAIVRTVSRVEGQVDSSTKVITVIMTDGAENSSVEANAQAVNKVVTDKQKEGNWTFVFLGADRDAWADAQHLGFARGNTISYTKGMHTSSMRSLAVATNVATASAGAATVDFFSDAGQSESDYNIKPTDVKEPKDSGNNSTT